MPVISVGGVSTLMTSIAALLLLNFSVNSKLRSSAEKLRDDSCFLHHEHHSRRAQITIAQRGTFSGGCFHQSNLLQIIEHHFHVAEISFRGRAARLLLLRLELSGRHINLPTLCARLWRCGLVGRRMSLKVITFVISGIF